MTPTIYVVSLFLNTVVAASPLRAEFEAAIADFDNAQRTQSDQPQRAGQLFRLAAQRFESIAADGVANGRLEYNIGNCYLQAGDVGRAVLHYRRAQRLNPRDDLLADNLSVARSRRLTTISTSRSSMVLRNVFFWHYETALGSRTRAAIVLYLAFWALLIAWLVASYRMITVAAAFCAVCTVLIAGSIFTQNWMERHAPAGVVLGKDVVVYKGPGASYQRQFEQPLQPGVEFTLRERRSPWWNIELPNGQSGWIESSDADLVMATALAL